MNRPTVGDKHLKRCTWCGEDPLYVHYHDTVWGRPEKDSLGLFEKLCLDGQQAGLSWITILRKQDSYREAYDNFDPEKIVRYNQRKKEALLNNPGVIRNRLKVESIIKNARGYLQLQEEGVAFNEFIWSFVDGKPIQNQWRSMKEVPVNTPVSDAMAKALKKRGFSFVGSTICYAFMQAVGMVNDHFAHCHCWQDCYQLGESFSL